MPTRRPTLRAASVALCLLSTLLGSSPAIADSIASRRASSPPILAVYVPRGLPAVSGFAGFRDFHDGPEPEVAAPEPVRQAGEQPLSGTWPRIGLGALLISIMIRRARPALPR